MSTLGESAVVPSNDVGIIFWVNLKLYMLTLGESAGVPSNDVGIRSSGSTWNYKCHLRHTILTPFAGRHATILRHTILIQCAGRHATLLNQNYSDSVCRNTCHLT